MSFLHDRKTDDVLQLLAVQHGYRKAALVRAVRQKELEKEFHVRKILPTVLMVSKQPLPTTLDSKTIGKWLGYFTPVDIDEETREGWTSVSLWLRVKKDGRTQRICMTTQWLLPGHPPKEKIKKSQEALAKG